MTRQRIVIKLVATGGAITLLSEVGADPINDADSGILSRPHLLSSTTMSMSMPKHNGIPAGFAGGVADSRVGSNPQISNPRKALSNERANADLLGLRFERTTARIYTSSKLDPVQDLTDPDWSSFAVKVVRLAELGIGRIEIRVEPLTQLLADERLDIPEYWALAASCLHISNTDDAIGISDANGGTLQPGLSASFCWEPAGIVILAGDLLSDAVWVLWGNGTTTGMRVRTNVAGAGNIIWEIFGLSTDTLTSADDVLEEGGGPYTISMRRNTIAQTLTLFLNGAVIASASSVTGAITDPSASITLGNQSSRFRMGEMRFHQGAPSDADIATHHDHRIPVPTSGLAGLWRDGATLWPDAVGSADTDESDGTPAFTYLGEGFPGADEGVTHPFAWGRVFNVELEYTWVAGAVAEAWFGEITAGTLYDRGVEQTGGGVNYTLNEIESGQAFPGLIRFPTDPQPISEIRLTGNQGTFTGEELLQELLFVAGPLDPTLVATEFVDGIAMGEEVGLYLEKKQGGWQSLPVVKEMAFGLDAVVIADEAGDFSVFRVPALDWAPPAGTNDGEQDAILTAGVEFIEGDDSGRGGDLSIDGDVPGIYSSKARYRVNAAAPIGKRDLDLSNPATDGQIAMQATHLEAEYTQPPTFVVENRGRLEGSLIESHYVFEADALANAKRRATGSLSLGGRSFRIQGPLRRTVPGIYRLGAKVLLKSGLIDAEEGVPCTVTDFQAPTGSLGLRESRIARVQPDEIVSVGNFNATVDEIDDHPLKSSATFADTTSTVSTLRVGFPAPAVADTGELWQFRVRLEATGSAESRIEIALSEAGSGIGALKIEVLSGPGIFSNGLFSVAIGDTAVFSAEFDPTDVTDLADLEIFVTVTGSAGHVGQISGIDYRYIVR